jgi:hypothetical protein
MSMSTTRRDVSDLAPARIYPEIRISSYNEDI